MAGPMHKPALVLALGGKPGAEDGDGGGMDADVEESCKEFFDAAGLHTHDGNHIRPLDSDKARFKAACEALVALIQQVAADNDKDEGESEPEGD